MVVDSRHMGGAEGVERWQARWWIGMIALGPPAVTLATDVGGYGRGR